MWLTKSTCYPSVQSTSSSIIYNKSCDVAKVLSSCSKQPRKSASLSRSRDGLHELLQNNKTEKVALSAFTSSDGGLEKLVVGCAKKSSWSLMEHTRARSDEEIGREARTC